MVICRLSFLPAQVLVVGSAQPALLFISHKTPEHFAKRLRGGINYTKHWLVETEKGGPLQGCKAGHFHSLPTLLSFLHGGLVPGSSLGECNDQIHGAATTRTSFFSEGSAGDPRGVKAEESHLVAMPVMD